MNVFASTIALALSMQLVMSSALARSLVHCALTADGSRSSGTCAGLLEEDRTLVLSPEPSIASGIWTLGQQPVAIWTGTMSDKNDGADHVEIEEYANGTGVLRTEYGWYAVSNITPSPNVAFDVDSSGEIPPNETDAEIIERARLLLTSPAAWNRADTRRCPAAATTWSIYCAMEKADMDVTGGFHHRRPALEVVRNVIQDRTASRNYHHRLMDYNNDRTTTVNDVDSVFAEALAKMHDASWLQSHQFSAP